MSTGPNIVPRADWGARQPKRTADRMTEPAKFVFIHHSAGAQADTKDSCIAQVRSFQKTHMDDKNWDDIGYSFVVGEDGNAYEARGWMAVGAHTYRYNRVGVGICIIGTYKERTPNAAAINTVKQLIQLGCDLGHINSAYTLKGHRDVCATECPGDQLYSLIQSWPRIVAGKREKN